MRIKINSLIVGMSFFLIIFHTFTFLQAYYSFIITLLAFMFILALCLIKSKGVFKIKGDPIIMLFFFVGILIVVGVALETYKQLEGSLLTRNYKKGYSRR